MPRVRQAMQAARNHLLAIQKEDGHWRGELEGDTILGSEYILIKHYLGRTGDSKVRKAAQNIRQKQLPAGGWSIYPGGPAEVSASVKSYLVLKLVGDSPDEPHMARARETILRLGGIEACNSFTKIYLAIFGEYPWKKCPAIPPEIILLPRWLYINIYEMSSWSRAIIIPLSIIWATKPHRPLPPHARIPELLGESATTTQPSFWPALFTGLDQGIKLLEKMPIKPSRRLALRKAEEWILERLEGSDGLGAIFPPIVNTIIALESLGHSVESPMIQRQIRELEKLEIEDETTLRVQPCFSPVWDTALALNALVESGLPSDHPKLLSAASWLLGRRGNGTGDWRIKNNKVNASGWFFEYANPHYPDNDTTAKVLTALSKVRFPDAALEGKREKAIREAEQWLLSMQNNDGGWAAFDRECNKEMLSHVPFADHNAMIDPSSEDITARIMETLSCLGHDGPTPAIQQGRAFLLRRQEADGSWYGRWGCNYLYGTWLALCGMACIGADMEAPWAARAYDWFHRCQNLDGGWGELPLSYEDPTQKGHGPSTSSQTAWSLLGLMAGGRTDCEAIRRGVGYLLDGQAEDGSWSEEFWTGTGFPGVFYLRYHLYGVYFPLLALSRFQKLHGWGSIAEAGLASVQDTGGIG